MYFFFQYKVLPIFGQVIGYISGKNRLIMTKQHSSYTGLVGIMILKIEQCTYYAEYVHVTYYILTCNSHQHEQRQGICSKAMI